MENGELDRLKSEEEAAFHRKQEAYERYQEARKRTDAAYQEQEEAWGQVTIARNEMNQAYNEYQCTRRDNDSVWSEYKRIRDNNNSQISYLKAQADSLYNNMSSAFGRASDAYNYGNKSDAKIYSNEGKDYQAQLKSVNAQISRLGQEVKEARTHAEAYGCKTNFSGFNSAKNKFENAKSAHKLIEAKFKSAKAERERLHSEFKALDEEYKRKTSAFRSALANMKAEQKVRQQNDEGLMEKANIPYAYRKDCKVVKEADGTINFYFGGLMEKDGLWHGHIAMDSSGEITYKRMPMEDHGKQNYTDYDEISEKNSRIKDGVTIYDRRLRANHEVLGINGYFNVRTKKGHNTHYYDDGWRESRDTLDGVNEINKHWTNQNIPKRKRKKNGKGHEKPDDAR